MDLAFVCDRKQMPAKRYLIRKRIKVRKKPKYHFHKNSTAMRILNELFMAWDQTLGRFSYRNAVFYLNHDNRWPWDFHDQYYRQALNRMKKRGLVDFTQLGPKMPVKITKTAWRVFQKLKIENLQIAKPPRWDGKLRLAIFDIPEKYKAKRNALRRKLKELAFKQVQKSVWVCPYPCRNELAELCRFYEIEPYVSLFEGKYLGKDKNLLKAFGL